MDIALEPVPSNKESVLKKMLELYSYDFTEFVDYDLSEDGSYGYPLEKYNYWGDPSRKPFFIRANGKLAGFVLLRILHTGKDEMIYSIAEFFILKKYRRHSLGRKIALMLFETYEGKWKVDQVDINYPAHVFWRTVIDQYTKGRFIERHADGRMIQEFTTKK